MRPLNRPMFRYGGPIKEGVMSGIREPKKNGNIVGGRQSPKLAGAHPLKDASGREHHLLPAGMAIGAGLQALRMGAMRMAPRAITGIKNLFRTQTGTKAVPKQGPDFVIPGGNIYSKGFPGGKVPARTITPGTGDVPIFSPNFLGRDPTVRLVGGAYKAVTNPAVSGMASKAARLVFSPTGLVTGAVYFGGKFFDSDGNEIKDAKEKGLTAGDKVGTSGAPGGGDPGMFLTPQGKQPGEGVTLSAKEKRKNQIQKYRDIMDIKGMNKAAAYDSLIAASKAIGESGDFKGDIKSGKLINQIIQATSKAFDKPKQTKDAIDTLILKGEIEKDIKASDPANKVLNELRAGQLQKINKELEGTSFAEAKIAASKTMSGQSGIDAAASVSSDNFRGNLLTKTQLTDVMEKAKGSGEISEQDIIIAATTEVIKGKNLPDGDYTVGDVLVTIEDGQIIPGSIKR